MYLLLSGAIVSTTMVRMGVTWLAMIAVSLCLCAGTRVRFLNQVNMARVLSWRDSLWKAEEKRWTSEDSDRADNLESQCAGEGVEEVEYKQTAVGKEDWKVVKTEGNVLCGKFHGRLAIHLVGRRLLVVKMCLGKVCGPIQVYEGNSLVRVQGSLGTWVFDTRLVESFSFVKNQLELTFIILKEDDEANDLVVFGKANGDIFYKARLQSVEIKEKFARPVFILGDQALFNNSLLIKHRQRTNFWYKNVSAILSLNKTMEVNVKKRQNFEHRCPSSITKYVSKYGFSEESFITSKVIPNLPLEISSTINCSNIFQTRPDHARNRTGFVSFPGSGALWIR